MGKQLGKLYEPIEFSVAILDKLVTEVRESYVAS